VPDIDETRFSLAAEFRLGVIPVTAGIHAEVIWIAAFAGMAQSD